MAGVPGTRDMGLESWKSIRASSAFSFSWFRPQRLMCVYLPMGLVPERYSVHEIDGNDSKRERRGRTGPALPLGSPTL